MTAPQFEKLTALNSLSPQRRAFVLAYVCGEDDVRGKAGRAYLAVYNTTNLNSASANASALLADPSIQDAILEVQSEMDKVLKLRIGSWGRMAEKAARLIERHLDSSLGLIPQDDRGWMSTNDISLAKEVLDRFLGKTPQTVEHDVGNRLDALIKELAGRRSLASLPPSPIAHAEEAEFSIEGEIARPGDSTPGMGREREHGAGDTTLTHEPVSQDSSNILIPADPDVHTPKPVSHENIENTESDRLSDPNVIPISSRRPKD